MADTMEIIISAVDSASEVFQSIISSATSMADGISGAIEGASSDFDAISENVAGFSDAVANIDDGSLEQLADQLGMDTEEVERLIAAGADMGTLSAGFNEASSAADELEQEIQDDIDKMEELGSAGDVMAAQTFMDMANSMKDSMLGMADSAGTFGDSIMRASLEAEGAGVSVDEMKSAVSSLSEETGRAGGQIRESFIKATARGVTDMDSFKTMMKGAGAQATLFGTDIQTMGDKFSSLAMKDTLMTRTLSETGITMNELATAMGMTGATADEVKAKWKELDTNQRAAILGTAASMNEGKGANEAYKNSWAGLQEQMEIAKGRLERIVGSVILPVLIPAMKLAGDILNGVGDVISGIMSGPFSGFVRLLGTLGGVFIIAVSGALALKNMMAFLKLETELAAVAQTAETFATIAQSEAGYAGAVANLFQTSSFSALATSAWAAATAIWAAVAPLLPFIAAAALIVVAIYEVGKAFGWWTDVSSMIDAIQAGIMRLWNAFINHPDVQAAISMISNALSTLGSWIVQAGQAVLEFFGINSEGNFDIVRALIDAIGNAWNMITWPIRQVIGFVQQVIGVFDQFRSGQMDLPTFIMSILTLAWNAYNTIFGRIINLVLKFGSQLLARGVAAARGFVNGVVNRLKQLPNRAYSALMQVVGRITSAGASWVSNVKTQAGRVVSGAYSVLSQTAGKVRSALSGVVNALTAPFRSAWKTIEPIYNNIKNAISMIPGMAGYDYLEGQNPDGSWNIKAAGYELDNVQVVNNEQNVTGELTVVHDLRNVPPGTDERLISKLLLEGMSDDQVGKALAENLSFQSNDLKVKNVLSGKINRSRGV